MDSKDLPECGPLAPAACEVEMAALADRILIVDEISSDRQELARALEAEGFQVVQAESASSAVREIWEGSYIVVFVSSILTGADPASLVAQLRQMAPEIETVVHSKNDDRARLVKKAIEIRDGGLAA
jgi:PleD family two-component response regulator